MATVLIVEHEPASGAQVAQLLGGQGYQTRLETNGAAALLAAHEMLPDLILLLDLMLPILEGEELLHALRRHPEPPTSLLLRWQRILTAGRWQEPSPRGRMSFLPNRAILMPFCRRYSDWQSCTGEGEDFDRRPLPP